MPRKSRLFIHNSTYVITAKCIDSLIFFKDENDYKKILDLLKRGLDETGFSCCSFLLLPTQYILIIHTNHHPLHKLMKRLNTSYALYYNRKYKRKGYFFDDRYDSSIIDTSNCLNDIICQINLLPFQAGICKTLDELDQYIWSSHTQFIGKKNSIFHLPSEILNKFSKNGKCDNHAWRDYANQLKKLSISPSSKSLFCKTLDFNGNQTNTFKLQDKVVGSEEFKTRIYALDEENRLELKIHKKKHWNISHAVEAVKDNLKIKTPGIFPRGRNNTRSTARKVFAYVCIWQLEFKTVEVARYLKISCAAVINLARCGKGIVEKNGINLAII
jgi:hypothetical protein